MVALLLAWVMSVGQEPPDIEARVDRTNVVVGEQLVLTVTVTARGASPIRIDDPTLVGLELLGRREQTRVTIQGGVPTRVTTRELTLRALRAGSAAIGPVRVQQAGESAETGSLTIVVAAPAEETARVLAVRLAGLIETAPPPPLSPDQAAVAVLVAPRTALVGEQVDLLVVAWFPRSVRTRLRNPPTLEAPAVRGAWMYHRPAPTGVALSRRVSGVWYDLYVLHEVAFPVTAGTLEVGPARLSYNVPLSGSFLSRELRHEVESGITEVQVRALPSARGTAGFRGAVAGALRFDLEAPGGELRLGEAVRVRASLSGRGNVALWPEPELEWPVGLNAYPQEVEVNLTAEDGWIGGVKVFEYLVVADSAGTHQLPDARYAYFDLARDAYVTIGAAPVVFMTPGGSGSVAPLRAVPPLMTGGGGRPLDQLAQGFRWWSWVLVILIPAIVAAAIRWRARWWSAVRRAPRARPTVEQGTLRELEVEFRRTLERLVPQAGLRAGTGLGDALRAAGVDASLAAHAARVSERLQHATYGPAGTADPDELSAEVGEVLRALGGPRRARTPAPTVAAVGLLLLGGAVANPAWGQTPEALYDAGAAREAADSFRVRAGQSPFVPAHWHNLGNALERLGERARARAAWLRAARLAPRHAVVRRALALAPAPDVTSQRLTRVAPVTPGEATLAAVLLWIAACGAFALRARRGYVALVAALAIAAGAYAQLVQHRYAAPVALVLREDTPMREAPYGTAAAVRRLETAAAVRVERAWGPWRLVTSGRVSGWLLETELERL